MSGNKLNRIIRRLKARIALDKRTFIIYSVLRLLVLVTLIRCIMTQRWEGVAISVLVLVLFLVPSIIESAARVDIPPLFQTIIYVFIFAAEILGEIDHYYVLIPGWDTVLHTLNGFLCAAVGFSLVDLLNRSSDKITLSPTYVTIVAFCFSMTIGVLWEFFEFGFDTFFGMDMQKDTIVNAFSSVALDPTGEGNRVRLENIASTVITTASGETTTIAGYLDIGLLDTMKDLFVNLIGAIAFSIVGYRHLKRNENGNWADGLHVQPVSDERYEEEEKKISQIEKAYRSRRKKKNRS
ncbi:MAG: hypothetical protein ACOYJL_02300 [Tractidigestivibacter sp.]|jgi:hypothetical protein|uniref:hypothetical protein n=1 Tax=Tractidigestivibacter sp. TaxID=2847320 RepID=UPI003D8BF0BA